MHASAFEAGVLRPLRSALGGAKPRDWLESEAERYAQLGKSGCYVELNSRLREALGVKHIVRPEYVATSVSVGGAMPPQTGSIFLTDGGHRVSVLRAGGTADIRALEAHEFGHALLFSDQRVWQAITRRGLLVDPNAERLADDAGYALVLPQSILLECLAITDFKGEALPGRDHLWARLPKISRLAALPYRLVATRIASLLVEADAALICYAVPRQHDLFDRALRDEAGIERVPVTVSWIMRYSWLESAHSNQEYFLSDNVAASRRTLLSGTELALLDNADFVDLTESVVKRLVGEENWRRICGFGRFTRVAASAYDDKVRHFVLCR